MREENKKEGMKLRLESSNLKGESELREKLSDKELSRMVRLHNEAAEQCK